MQRQCITSLEGADVSMKACLRSCCILSALCVTLVSADMVDIRSTRVDNQNTMRVQVAYQLTSRDTPAEMLLRAQPVALNRQLEIGPRAVVIGQSDAEQFAEFVVSRKGDEPLEVDTLIIGFVAAGHQMQRPFFSRTFAVNWRFPLHQAAGTTGVPAGTAPDVPAALGADVDEVDNRVDLTRVAIYRRYVAALTRAGTRELIDALRDKRLINWMTLHMAVSQEGAAEAELPIGENMPDIEHPGNDDPGVGEVEVTVEATERENRVTNLRVVNISSPFRGYYQVNFAYHINDITDRFPITFDCVFDDATFGAYITQAPWIHAAPVTDFDGNGIVGLWLNTPEAPLATKDPEFHLRARGPANQQYASIGLRPTFSFYKAYDMMTSTNIRDHFDNPDYTTRTQFPINEGSNSILGHTSRYPDEPALLTFRTASGTLCRGFFKPHKGAQGLEGLWIIDLDCFGAKGPAWYEGHVPADPNDYVMPGGMRSYDIAGLMTRGHGFDLDWSGFDCDQSTSDIAVNVEDDGTYVLRTRNGCEMRY